MGELEGMFIMTDQRYPLIVYDEDTDSFYVTGLFSTKVTEGEYCGDDCNDEGYAKGVLTSELLNGPGPHPPSIDDWPMALVPEPIE